MPRYTYTAIAADGKKAKGTVTAESPYAARKQLRVRNIHPTAITELGAAEEGRSVIASIFSRTSKKNLIDFTRQMAECDWPCVGVKGVAAAARHGIWRSADILRGVSPLMERRAGQERRGAQLPGRLHQPGASLGRRRDEVAVGGNPRHQAHRAGQGLRGPERRDLRRVCLQPVGAHPGELTPGCQRRPERPVLRPVTQTYPAYGPTFTR